MLKEKTIIRFNKACRAHSFKRLRGWAEEAEDFSSWATIKLLEGRKATVSQHMCRYMRDFYVDPATSITSRAERKSFLHPKQIKEYHWMSDVNPHVVLEAIPWKKLPKNMKPIFLLYYKWGLSHSEIGELYGMSKQTVDQKISKTIKSFKRKKYDIKRETI